MEASQIRRMRSYLTVFEGRIGIRKVLAIYVNGDGAQWVHWQECFGHYKTSECPLAEFAKKVRRERGENP